MMENDERFLLHLHDIIRTKPNKIAEKRKKSIVEKMKNEAWNWTNALNGCLRLSCGK